MLLNSAEFTPADGRERWAAPILRLAVRTVLKPALSPSVPISWQRRWLSALTRSTQPRGLVDIRSGVLGGTKGEWVRARRTNSNTNGEGAILYLHGGAYCVGSPATHRAVTSHLARAARLPVFAADYRLAPEHPFPAAVEDSISAYRALLEIGPVVIAGDSAGAGLALATALTLQQQNVGAPAALVLFSPWVDLTTSAIADGAPSSDAMLSAPWLRACARHYLAGKDPMSPLASPIYGDLRGLPPTLIQAGADELLYDQAVRIHDALQSAGVGVRCEIVPKRWHAFQLHAGLLPSANAAIKRAASFITLNLAS
jgi:acetyl esterase/lipase